MQSITNLLLILMISGSVYSQSLCSSDDDIGQCVLKIAQTIYEVYSTYNRWHDHEELIVFDTKCMSSIKGGFYRWQWRWQGRFWCPALSTIEGYSNDRKSRKGAIEHAIENYVRKGIEHGFLNIEQLGNIRQLISTHS